MGECGKGRVTAALFIYGRIGMGLQQTVDKWTAQSRGVSRGGGVGGSGPEVPFLDFDFTLQRYRANGANVAVDDYLVEDLGWGSYDSSVEITDAGLHISDEFGSASNPTLSPALMATLLAAGTFTVVFDFVPDIDVGKNSNIGIAFYTNTSFDSDWYAFFTVADNLVYSGRGNMVSDNIGPEYDADGFMDEGQSNRIATRFTPKMITSVVGGFGSVGIATVVGADPESVRDTISIFGSGQIRAMKIYLGHKTDADLIQLTG